MNVDYPAEFQIIWNALHAYREDLIPEGDDNYDEQWDEICTAMSRLREAVLPEPTEEQANKPSNWWASEYRYFLSGTTPDMRLRVYMALISSGLHPSGVSVKHHDVIYRTTEQLPVGNKTTNGKAEGNDLEFEPT